jgi:hypothetical protein
LERPYPFEEVKIQHCISAQRPLPPQKKPFGADTPCGSRSGVIVMEIDLQIEILSEIKSPQRDIKFPDTSLLKLNAKKKLYKR